MSTRGPGAIYPGLAQATSTVTSLHVTCGAKWQDVAPLGSELGPVLGSSWSKMEVVGIPIPWLAINTGPTYHGGCG